MENNKVSLKKITFFMIIFSIIILGVKVLWAYSSEDIKTLEVVDGQVEITEDDYKKYEIFHLDGDWEFYPDTLLSPNDIKNHTPLYENVPSNWNDTLTLDDEGVATGVGTYRLQLEIPDDLVDIHSFYLTNIHSAAKVYVNEDVRRTMGTVSEQPEEYIGKAKQMLVPFRPDGNTVDLIVQVANHDLPNYGGILKSVKFGKANKIDVYKTSFDVMQIVLVSFYLLHGIYGVILFLMGRRQRDVIYYVLITIASATSALFDGQQFGMSWFDTSLIVSLKIKIIAYTAISLFVLLTLQHIYARSFVNKASRYLLIVHGILIVIIMILPIDYLIYTLIMSSMLTIITFGYITYINIINRYYSEKYYHILIFLNICLVSGIISNIYFNYSNLNLAFFPFETVFVFMGLVILIYKYSISERNEIEYLTKRLKEAIQLKDLLIGNITQKLKTPIQTVENMAKVIESHKDNTEEDQDRLKLITLASQHMSIVIDNLFDITKLQDDEIRLDKSEISVYEIVDNVIPIYTLQNEKNVEVINNIPRDFPSIYADYSKMIQVFSILIQNALKYTEEGNVTISTEIKGNNAHIIIKDTGVGISESIIEHIYNPYVSDSRRAGRINVGLELYVCKALIELHGGKISIDTEKDKGSTYMITVPIYDEREHKQTLIQTKKVNEKDNTQIFVRRDKRSYRQVYKPDEDLMEIIKGAKILIVDIDRMNIENLVQSLNENYNVKVVNTTDEAYELISKGKFDLVLSEVLMPKTSGLMLTQKLREKFTSFELPIILFSSSDYNDEKYSSFIVGANDFILKPIDVIELKSRVFSSLTLKKSIKEHLQMEAAWLQAQIRPHFLYNTLGTIISYSYTDQAAMVKLLEDFSTYLRRSFSTSNMHNLVPLNEEFELIYSY